MSGMTGGSAGWRQDPENPGQVRYWDGAAWSVYSYPVPPGEHQPEFLTAGRRQGAPIPWWQTWYAIVPGLLLCLPLGLIGLWYRPGTSGRTKISVTAGAGVVLLGFAFLAPGDPANTPAEAEDAASSETPTPSDTPVQSVPEEPTLATVPSLKGLDLKTAKRALREAGLKVQSITRKPSAKVSGTVLKQDVPRGDALEPGSPVSLVVAEPFPRTPGVVGQSEASAIQQLKEAGFRVRTSTETRTSGEDGVVLNQSPSARMRARPGSIVRIDISDVVEPAPLSAPSNCTPGYEPCLTPASDYDCAGGSGNGPAYASGPIYISGSDPYDLDRDGDGVACE